MIYKKFLDEILVKSLLLNLNLRSTFKVNMQNQEFQKGMKYYLERVPYLSRLQRDEAEAIVKKASETSIRTGISFFSICDNLVFQRCIELRIKFW
jgi:hypothetical protein